MLKYHYLSILAAFAIPALATIEDPRKLPLVACLGEEDVSSHIVLQGQYGKGTALDVDDPTDQVTGKCKDEGAKQQVSFGELEVSAHRGSKTSFLLHTFPGGDKALDVATMSEEDIILSQECTITILDWPSGEKPTFYGLDVSKVFPSVDDFGKTEGATEGLFDLVCTETDKAWNPTATANIPEATESA